MMRVWPDFPHPWLAAALAAICLPVVGAQEVGVSSWQKELGTGASLVRVSGVSFPDRTASLRVLDNPPDSAFKLAQAAASAGALAGCNASYFHADGRPLGLVVADGEILHRQERAKLLSGILAVRNGRIELVRAGDFRPGPDVTQAVQSGPWLLDNNTPVEGLDTVKRARRTVVATDGRGRWALIVLASPTLAETARLLAEGPSPTGWKVRSALNLDGGGSSALWVRDGFSLPEYGHVRNFLLVVPTAERSR